jgi:hypothetical protein
MAAILRSMDNAAGTQTSSPGLESLEGLIERVTFHSPESGFCVLRVKVRGNRDMVTVIGTLAQVRAGEWIQAQGVWAIDHYNLSGIAAAAVFRNVKEAISLLPPQMFCSII